jgi:hypothetical protein
MSSLLGDFKKSVREGLRKLGDHEGFDYLIFLSRILSYMQQADEQRRVKLGRESREFEKGLRSVEQAIEQFHWSHDQKEGPHLTLDGQCQGGSFKARSPDTEKKTLTVKLPGDYNSTRKLGRLAGNGPDSIPGPCNLSITALKGLNIHIPCHENFPNTLIEMSLVTNEVVHFSKKSELMLRQADPNWNCSHRLTVESLEEFIEVNTPLQLVLKLYLRRYGRLASEGLFVTEEIGTAKLDFSDLINADELRSLLLGQRKTVLTTIKVALGKLGGAVEVQCELTASDRDSLAESWQATQVQPLEHLKGTLKEVRRLPEREGMEGYDITQIGLQNLMLTLKEVNQENRYSTEHEVEAWAKEDRFEGLRNWRDDWKNTVERLKSKDPEELSISFENRRSISVADIGFYNPSGKPSLSNRF